jgi:glycosyltransferase involved in cell wall biosynthesis
MNVVPRVSVIIATYNWATVLPFSIGSVLDQTFTDFELLVVGDGCTDESADVVASFQDPRVHWVNLPRNTGHQAGPNNEGARLARGGVMAYLGHDDLWLPNHLEVLVAAIDGGAQAAHSSALQVHPIECPTVTPAPGWAYSPGRWIYPTSMLLTREILSEVGGWRMPSETGYMVPDTDLWARVNNIMGAPVWIQRLTCLKFPAVQRRHVYRSRPHFEQEHWLTKIREASDPEAVILAAAGTPYVLAKEAPRTPLRVRAWRSLRLRLRRLLGVQIRSTTRIRESRRYRGL